MKVLKSVLIYSAITLAVLTGLSIILFGLMYFFPSIRIFNLGLIHYNKTIESEEIDLDEINSFDNIQININSKSLDVQVMPCEIYDIDDEGKKIEGQLSNIIDANLKLRIFGLTSDITEYNLSDDYEVINNTLHITYTVTEPDGWISKSGSEVVVNVPYNFKYNLNVTTDNGNIHLGNKDCRMNLNALSIDTKKGELSFENLCDREEDEIVLDYLNLNFEQGDVDFSSITNINVNTHTILTGKNTKFNFKNLFSAVNATGNNITLNAQVISCDDGFNFITDKAKLDIEKLEAYNASEISIVTSDCDADITKIDGDISIVTTTGKVKLGIVSGECNIDGNKAYIEITNVKDDLNINSNAGNVCVKNYERNGCFVINGGSLEAFNNSELYQGIMTSVTANNAKIKVSNNVNLLELSAKGESSVDVTFKEIANMSFEHKVELGTECSGIVYLPTSNFDKPFKFVARGNISGQIVGVNSGTYVTSSDDPQYFPSSSTEDIEKASNNCSFVFNGTIKFAGYSGK